MTVKRISKIIVCALIATLFSLCFAACGEKEITPDDGYEATKMSITATVNADCTVNVVEEMTIHYIEPSRGWLRYLPTNSGEQYRNVKASGDEFEMSHKLGFFVIRFGEEDMYFKEGATADYRIEYTLVLPEVKDDVFAYNIVGNDYDMARFNITLTVNFPAPIESENVYFGKKGSTAETDARFEKKLSEDKKRLTLTSVEGEGLGPFEGVTVKARLFAGTFSKPIDLFVVSAAVAGVVLFALALLARFVYARQDKPLAVVNFYPPKGEGNRQLSPAQAGMLIDGTCSSEDVTSLLFFWASKGCLEIEDTGGDTKLIYKSDLDGGAPEYEKTMFQRLFKNAAEDESGEKSVMLSSLTNKFYGTVSHVQGAVSGEYKHKMYSKGHSGVAFGLVLMSAVYVFALTFVAFWSIRAGWFNFLPLAAIIPAILSLAIGSAIYMNTFKMSKAKAMAFKLLHALFVAAASVALVCLLPLNALNVAAKITVGILFGLTVYVAPYVGKRTEFYNDKLGELIGFRDFLRYAEKDKLEMLLKDNPQYYYDILPYANALGVSRIWQDKFENLTIAPPRYYRMSAGDVFTIMLFNDMFRRTNANCRNTMISRPQPSSHGSSGGGFGGGGGFTGGGFGGGGSRRW